VRRRVVISGRVQAVGFRASCARRATQAGVSGWVRNTPDGAVEAVFEGTPQAVEALLQWCRGGPPMARVVSVDVAEEQPRGDRGFSVR
jgi:acylphosphatase